MYLSINFYLSSLFFGDPWENRTPDSAVRGQRLSRLTNGPDQNKIPQINHVAFYFDKNSETIAPLLLLVTRTRIELVIPP